MRLLQLRLHQFRSYEQLTLMPPPGITILIGENGAGKTNLLEAIHLCCLGRSHRTSNDRDMIRIGSTTCAVHARVARTSVQDEVGVRLFAAQGERKIVFVNGKTVPRMGELMGHMTCVMFSPEDLDLVKGAPKGRRVFLDMLLSQSQAAYFYALQHYNGILRQRNALLKEIARGRAEAGMLDIWDEQLAKAAAPIVIQRRDAANAISELATEHYTFIAGRKTERFFLRYQGTFMDSLDPEADMRKRLAASREDDLRRLSTGPGPHRDDLQLMLSGNDMRAFASQGQARTAALAMRLAQIDILTRAHKETPLLLLDDVMSELDEGRQARLLVRLDRMQTLLTCTELNSIQNVRPSCVLTVKGGTVKAI
ncbi:MAG: DNA replication/repair protein RecF [Christensenellales bacterium]|jgi:DNA replication and repair protein RecF|nr:DNA replication/repair protein RecF [Clostridiales bacterium]